MTTGEALVEMADALLHRGPDSAGYALYREALEGALRLRFLVRKGAEAKEDVTRIKQALVEHGAEIVEDETVGCIYGAVVRYAGDVRKFSFTMEHAARMVSLGISLDIIKDVGHPRELAQRYGISQFNGTHAIAHTRLATESGVHPETSHPFWATGFADVAVVHNGQVTNYWILRRRLEREGMEFHTDNDTELIAVYLAFKMSRGCSLEEALRASLVDLDGTFSCLVATRDSIGYAKDKLAAKPMVKYEDEYLVAIASEEVALNRLFPGRVLMTTEPPPLTYGFWSRH
jgi:glutamate synthase domain-containing protein 1